MALNFSGFWLTPNEMIRANLTELEVASLTEAERMKIALRLGQKRQWANGRGKKKKDKRGMKTKTN
jgi:hypothetical protein